VIKIALTLRDLAPAAIMIVVAAIVITVGADILQEIRDGQTSPNYDYNVSTSGLEAMEELGDWLPTIALIVAAVIVIDVIVVYFGRLQ